MSLMMDHRPREFPAGFRNILPSMFWRHQRIIMPFLQGHLSVPTENHQLEPIRVLNTDNMSILGLTMDYGPFGFMDRFMWDHICNASDTDGRYTYAQQPSVCAWNCARLAECLIRVLGEESSSLTAGQSGSEKKEETSLVARFRTVLDSTYTQTYLKVYLQQMRKKLGLFASDVSEDDLLFKSLFDTMEQTGADFTNTFLALGSCVADATDQNLDFRETKLNPDQLLDECCDVDELREAYEPSDLERQREMLHRFAGIVRHLIERIDDGKVLGTEEKARRLQSLENITQEEKRERDRQLWQTWLDHYFTRLRTDMKRRPDVSNAQRIALMRATNPRIVLRNFLAEQVIRAAEDEDYMPAEQLLEALRHPFTEGSCAVDAQSKTEFTNVLSSCSRPPEWSRELRVT
ncbi:unnamed protein product [Echinostoma caproni]|uniref:Selenoprotein O n=1 Tax=Echinostoma caproni TaxID=27848 RepID=A0A183AFT7_9TREM|nr:unnamed protein product [Echinostoma caproni]